jgi:threonine dehydratase
MGQARGPSCGYSEHCVSLELRLPSALMESDNLQSMLERVSIEGIRGAATVIYRHLAPSPLLNWPLLDQEAGLRIFLKHENHLPTGAFKVRGGINFMSRFAAAHAERHPERHFEGGVITATRGNHGQSIALAARLFGISATIVVPEGNNPEKNAAMRGYGARVIEHGRDFDAAREEVSRLAATEGQYYIHSANEPDLINGVGTYAVEIIEEMAQRGERIDAVFVPIGLGSGICGVITAFRALSPTTRIIGVQAEGAPSIYLSWREGRIVETAEARTFADGVATRVPASLTFEIIRRGVDEIVLVDDSAIRRAIRLLWRTTHNMAEGAGAIATAAVLERRADYADQTVVSILCGGNLDTDSLSRIFAK